MYASASKTQFHMSRGEISIDMCLTLSQYTGPGITITLMQCQRSKCVHDQFCPTF